MIIFTILNKLNLLQTSRAGSQKPVAFLTNPVVQTQVGVVRVHPVAWRFVHEGSQNPTTSLGGHAISVGRRKILRNVLENKF